MKNEMQLEQQLHDKKRDAELEHYVLWLSYFGFVSSAWKNTMSMSVGQYNVQVCWSVQCLGWLVNTMSKTAGQYNVQVCWSVQCLSRLVNTMSKSAGQYNV